MSQYPEPFVVSLSNHERPQIRMLALRQAQGERLFMRHYLCRHVYNRQMPQLGSQLHEEVRAALPRLQAGDLTVGMNKDQRPNQYYDLIDPDTGISYPPNPNRVWAYIPESMNKLITERRVIFPPTSTKRPMLKRFKSELRSEVNPASTWLTSVGLNSEATRQIQDLLGSGVFSYPKPTTLAKELISISAKEDDIILDFFAGSGTTAHAVLGLNRQDGGNRKFILVQLPEPLPHPSPLPEGEGVMRTIADITRERVRRVIAKLGEQEASASAQASPTLGTLASSPSPDGRGKPEPLALRERGRGEGDLGFRAFKLDSSNFKIWRSDQAPQSAEQLSEQLKLYADNVQPDRSEQDRLYELVLKSGHALSARVEEIQLPVRPEPVEGRASTSSARTAFSVSDGNLLICLEPHLDRDTLRALFARKPQTVLCLDAAFDGNDALKTNIVLEAKSHGIVFKTV